MDLHLEKIENKYGSQPNITPIIPKVKPKKQIEIDSEYEDLLSEQLDTFTSNSPSRHGAYEQPKQLDIKKVEKRKSLVMGKKKELLPS